jgi:hypothetical protein
LAQKSSLRILVIDFDIVNPSLDIYFSGEILPISSKNSEQESPLENILSLYENGNLDSASLKTHAAGLKNFDNVDILYNSPWSVIKADILIK